MNVVCPMTITAAVADTIHRVQRLPVAFIAGRLEVCASQWEVRLRIVIELPCIPVDGIVTGGAISRETTVVRVFFGVAIHTQFRSVAKNMRLMATVAFGFGVHSK